MPSVFEDQKAEVFTTYHVRLRFRDRLMGGIPKDPKIIEGWLRSKAGIEAEDEVKAATIRTVRELDELATADLTDEQVLEAAFDKLAEEKKTTGFKKDAVGLYLESRTVKAMLREVTNILYAGERWGKTKKGPKSYLAERVFVEPAKLYFRNDEGKVKQEPDGVETFVGHVNGPKGPQSTLGRHEYMEQQVIEFDLLVCEDAIDYEAWPRLWVLAQENGLGALRSQGFGIFDIEVWDRVQKPTRKKVQAVA